MRLEMGQVKKAIAHALLQKNQFSRRLMGRAVVENMSDMLIVLTVTAHAMVIKPKACVTFLT